MTKFTSMCRLNSEIRFCTCRQDELTEEQKKILAIKFILIGTDYFDTYYKWTLYRFSIDMSASNNIIGEIQMPKDKVNEKITIDKVIYILNNTKPFDFEYFPKSKDYFEISEEYNYIHIPGNDRRPLDNYISCVFENNKWKSGYFDIGIIHTELNSGKVII